MNILSSIPAPPSNAISIGPLDLRLYGLMIALGVLAAVWMFGRMLERRGFGSPDDASSIGMWGVAAGIVGARLYHVITDWHRFSDNLGAIPRIWEGGLGVPGGVLAGVAVGAWQARRRGIPVLVGLTCAAPAIPLAQAIGRLGNYFNQELFGEPTSLPWALEVDVAHTPAAYELGTTFHPTFLYEMLWNLALVAVLLWIDRRHNPQPGRLFALYVAGYGLGRLWIEALRIDEATMIGPLRVNEWMSMVMIVGGLGWWFMSRNQATTWASAAGSVAGAGEAVRSIDDVHDDDEDDDARDEHGIDEDANDEDAIDPAVGGAHGTDIDRAASDEVCAATDDEQSDDDADEDLAVSDSVDDDADGTLFDDAAGRRADD